MLLLWSGGCDSTLLLNDLLADEKNEVRTLSVNTRHVINSEHAKPYRDKVASALKARGKKFERIEVTLSGTDILHGSGALSQPPIWLSMALLHLKPEEDLYLGYIKSDCIWHYKTEMIWGFDWLKKVMGKSGNIVMPLEWVGKPEVIQRLKKARLYKFTWYCEMPNGKKKCNKCKPCKTHKAALHGYE